jgi:hypothetical protein
MEGGAGLAAVAVALVAVAAKGLIAKTAKDRLTVFIMLTSAALAFTFEAPWLYPALIIGGGLATLVHNAYIHKNMALPVRCDRNLEIASSLLRARQQLHGAHVHMRSHALHSIGAAVTVPLSGCSSQGESTVVARQSARRQSLKHSNPACRRWRATTASCRLVSIAPQACAFC